MNPANKKNDEKSKLETLLHRLDPTLCVPVQYATTETKTDVMIMATNGLKKLDFDVVAAKLRTEVSIFHIKENKTVTNALSAPAFLAAEVEMQKIKNVTLFKNDLKKELSIYTTAVETRLQDKKEGEQEQKKIEEDGGGNEEEEEQQQPDKKMIEHPKIHLRDCDCGGDYDSGGSRGSRPSLSLTTPVLTKTPPQKNKCKQQNKQKKSTTLSKSKAVNSSRLASALSPLKHRERKTSRVVHPSCWLWCSLLLLWLSPLTVNGACQPGKYTDTKDCTDCPVGRYTEDANTLTTCNYCPKGYQQDKIGKQFCMPCAAGKYSLGAVKEGDAGATQCTVCEPGRHQKNTQSTTCVVSLFQTRSEFDDECFHV